MSAAPDARRRGRGRLGLALSMPPLALLLAWLLLVPSPPPPGPTSGRLAYVGGDGNVYVVAPGGVPVAVTGDATAPAEGSGLSYHRLSWSPEGWLAFAAVTRSGNRARSRLYVVEAPGQAPRLVAQDDENFIIYVYWSPGGCPGRPACRRLAYLISEEEGVGLHLVDLENGQVDDRLLGLGRPFYFSWSLDGRQMAWHTGGNGRYNEAASLALYDVEAMEHRPLGSVPGSFLAPAWSPAGEGWLGVTAEGELDRLNLYGKHGVETLLSGPGDEIVFAWSPDGRSIAYARREIPGAPFYGPIHVLDVETGRSRQVTLDAFRILGFFWAPAGQRLGYLTWLDLPDATWMQWRVYDLEREKDRGFAAFQPTPLMRFAVQSFNQYAQSHRFWSADGRYLVYADRDRALVERVWLVDTRAARGADPILVGEGSIGYWSWR